MFEFLRMVIALLGTALAGWIDFKTSDIPDKLVAGMIILAFGFHFAEFFLTGSAANLQSAFFWSVIFGIFSLVMYYGKAWGGGDGALLVSVAALLPASPFGISIIPFPLFYLLSVFFIGIFYSTFYMIWKIGENEKAKFELQKDFKGISVVSATTFLSMLSIFFFAVTQNIFSLALAFGFSFPLLEKLQKLSEKIFKKKIPVKDLRANDMLGEDLPKLGIKKLLRGLTAEEVKLIKKKMKFVVVADGVRFGPVFFFALLISLLVGYFLI